MNIPEELKYTKDHEWVRLQSDGTAVVGITDYAQESLGDITFIEFPEYYDGCRKEDGGDGKCGSPKGWLKKAANYKFPRTHPKAYKAYTKMSFSTTHIGQMAALVDVEGMTAVVQINGIVCHHHGLGRRRNSNQQE